MVVRRVRVDRDPAHRLALSIRHPSKPDPHWTRKALELSRLRGTFVHMKADGVAGSATSEDKLTSGFFDGLDHTRHLPWKAFWLGKQGFDCLSEHKVS